MKNNHTFRLPSGVTAIREGSTGDYFVHGNPAVLTRGDVEALYADSIAGDGGTCQRCGGSRREPSTCAGCAGERNSHVATCDVWRSCSRCAGTGREP